MRNWTKLVLICLTVAAAAYANEGISDQLRQKIESIGPSDWVSVNVILRDQVAANDLHPMVDGMNPSARRQYVVNYLKTFTNSSQRQIRNYLRDKSDAGDVNRLTVLWICNGMILDIRAYMVDELWRRFPSIQSIDLNAPVSVEQIIDRASNSQTDDPDDISWGVSDIGAPDVWDLGFTGQGVIIGHLDTGVDITHSDLADRIWVNPGEDLNGNGTIDPSEINGIDDDDNGYADDFYGWAFDTNSNQVQDDNGHGTSTAGIVCGTGFGGEQTGVAPGATLMVLKNSTGGESSFWQAQQYAIDNGAQVLTSSLSYKWRYAPKPNYAVFRQNAEMELAAGLVHSNSIGNEGDNQSTDPIPFNVSTPGNSPSAWLHPDQLLTGGVSSLIAVGAYGTNHIIKSYSSIGPSAWYLNDILALAPTYPYQSTWPPEYNDYPYQGGTQMALIKPDVCAPTDVQTTQRGGGYTSGFNGTSAATPHVGGCLCLLLSANPFLTPEQCSEALQMTAREAGAAGKDNYYGAGMVDVYQAVLSVMRDQGVVMGTVTDSMTTLPISDAQVSVVGSPISTTTNDEGQYQLTVIADTLLTIQASAFGYSSRLQQVTVPANDTSIVDFALPPAGLGTFAGWVVTEYGSPIEGAEIAVTSLPITPAYSNNSGYFEMQLPAGEVVDISVSAGGWLPVTDHILVPEGQVLYRTYALEQAATSDPTGPDQYGYYAYENLDYSELSPDYDWIEIDPSAGGSGILITMTLDDETQYFALPFDFTYYGISYDSVSVCGNGWLAMGHVDTADYSNSSIPSPDGPEAMIAPFWEDLSPQNGGTMSYAYLSQDHIWVVEWHDVPQYLPANTFESFQIVLYDPQYWETPTGDGEIMFQYTRVSDPTTITVGIENETETDGLQLLFDNVYAPSVATLVAGRAILFTTRSPQSLTGAAAGTLTLDGPGNVENALLIAGLITSNPASNGQYVLSDLPVGSVLITARAYGYIDSSVWVDVTAGDTLLGVDFALEYLPVPSDLSGTLVGSSHVDLIWESYHTLPGTSRGGSRTSRMDRGQYGNQFDETDQELQFLGYAVIRNGVVLDSTITDTTYRDDPTQGGIMNYFVRARFLQGTSDSTNHVIIDFPSTVGDNENLSLIPTEPYLSQNYPNPFNPSTTIKFGVSHFGHHRLNIYNVLGRKVETLLDGNLQPGRYQITWNAERYPTGMYFCAMATPDGNHMIRKMLLIK
jgi:subtilisin family serine protease